MKSINDIRENETLDKDDILECLEALEEMIDIELAEDYQLDEAQKKGMSKFFKGLTKQMDAVDIDNFEEFLEILISFTETEGEKLDRAHNDGTLKKIAKLLILSLKLWKGRFRR